MARAAKRTDALPRHREHSVRASATRYALIGVPIVIAGLVLWYLAATFLVAPTIDGPAADDVQGLATTTVEELVIGGEEVAPNDPAAEAVDQ
ncbi:hypothetical protein [Jannaschia sp. W003]|uniref:hypothetical protein n=1 Tax=Jannaschia sp. W003 TaxID=2867012 RepID=UPI0021A3320A|nr:hypothetical protein [Jannaschia sp. W003]UWQ22364.1 hypothetical protein K3554_04830 [Jannaschia sp. W003]